MHPHKQPGRCMSYTAVSLTECTNGQGSVIRFMQTVAVVVTSVEEPQFSMTIDCIYRMTIPSRTDKCWSQAFIPADDSRLYQVFRTRKIEERYWDNRDISAHETSFEIRVWRKEMVRENLLQIKCLDKHGNFVEQQDLCKESVTLFPDLQ